MRTPATPSVMTLRAVRHQEETNLNVVLFLRHLADALEDAGENAPWKVVQPGGDQLVGVVAQLI